MTTELLAALRAELRTEELEQYQLFKQIDALVQYGPPTWETWLNTEIAYYDVRQCALAIRNVEIAIREVNAARSLAVA